MAGRRTSEVKSVAGPSSSRKRKRSTSGEESVTPRPNVGPSTIEVEKLKTNELQEKVCSGAADAEAGGTRMTILSLLNMLISPREIMRFLSSADRRSCRLTCKEWNNLCAVYEDQEKMCIPSAFKDTLDSVLSVFTESNRSCLHFEFYAINFEKKARKAFWTACGPKIRSLKMINCKTTNAVIGGIIAHCSHLQELEFYFNDIEDMRYGIIIAYPSRIIPDGSRNESLRTLKIRFTSNEHPYRTLYWLEKLDQLFLLFPNISNFLFSYSNLRSRQFCWVAESSDSYLVDYYTEFLPTKQRSSHASINSSLHKYFVRNQMESIALSFIGYPWLDWTLLSNVKGLTKITEIALNPKGEGVEYLQNFLKFALHQMHLEKITCVSRRQMSDEMVDLLMSFVSKIPALRTLCLFLWENVIGWKNEWSKSLSSSRLETLQISCKELDCSANVEDSICTTLTNLAIEVEKFDVVPLIKSFPNLKALSLDHVDGKILECIGSHQLGLELLNVSKAGTDVGPQSSGAINKLKQLKYLLIPNVLNLRPKNLPCLEYLRVHRGPVWTPDNPDLFESDRFREYLTECPSLQVVYIDCCIFIRRIWNCNLNYRKWFVQEVTQMINLAGCLKILFLEFDSFFKYDNFFESDDEEDSAKDEDPNDGWDLTENDVVPIFEACPTLRVLIHMSIFVKDGVTGCIKKQWCDDLGKNEFLNMFLNQDHNDYKKCTSYMRAGTSLALAW